MLRSGRFSRLTVVLVAGIGLAACSGRRQQSEQTKPDAGVSVRPAGQLTPEKARQVLAKVGDRTITLGDYAAALERMDRFERLRYQSPERRKQLLDEIINLELLAEEAKKRGLDQDDQTQARLDQALRDELVRDLRSAAPAIEAIPENEVRAYYDNHPDEFREPERRRVAVIAVANENEARSLVERARSASPEDWGKLVRKHSRLRAPAGEQTPLELEGDQGIVSAPGSPSGTASKMADAVVQAVFQIEKLGEVYPRPVRAGDTYYVVRLAGRSAARTRSYPEAERSIRVRLVQEKLDQAERQLLETLKKQFPVTIDEAALARVSVPAPSAKQGTRDPSFR